MDVRHKLFLPIDRRTISFDVDPSYSRKSYLEDSMLRTHTSSNEMICDIQLLILMGCLFHIILHIQDMVLIISTVQGFFDVQNV